MSIEIKYQEVKLADVLAYFAKGFEFKDGSTLNSHEAFVDSAKGVVVFKLVTEKPSSTEKGTP